MPEKRTTVDLAFCLNFLTLIVKAPTGIWYTNQVGGTACMHPMVEGFAVPLDHLRIADRLGNITYNLYGLERLEKNAYDEIDIELRKVVDGLDIKLDMNMLEESAEAWIHVTIEESPKQFLPVFNLPPNAKGVIAWENSD